MGEGRQPNTPEGSVPTRLSVDTSRTPSGVLLVRTDLPIRLHRLGRAPLRRTTCRQWVLASVQ